MSKNKVIRQLVDAVDMAVIGSCTCNTKGSDHTHHKDFCRFKILNEAALAGEAELAKPEPEPVAWLYNCGGYRAIHWSTEKPDFASAQDANPLYTTPPEPSIPEGCVLVSERFMISCIEFINDWKKGDFTLPTLAAHDVNAMISSAPDYKW